MSLTLPGSLAVDSIAPENQPDAAPARRRVPGEQLLRRMRHEHGLVGNLDSAMQQKNFENEPAPGRMLRWLGCDPAQPLQNGFSPKACGPDARSESPHPCRAPRFLLGVLDGTGIGPEVMEAALQVLEALEDIFGFECEVRHGGRIGEAAYRRFVAGMTGLANRRYRPGPFPGKVTLFLTTETAYPAGDRRERIGRFARETRIVRVAGQRSGLFLPPAVNELAAKLQACLDEADAAAPEADVDAPHAAA
jgi:hypothetical protein